jgi:hypothetical protein
MISGEDDHRDKGSEEFSHREVHCPRINPVVVEKVPSNYD